MDVQTLHRQPGATPLDAARAAPAAHSPRAQPPATLGRKGPQRARTRTRHEVSSRLFTRGLTEHTSPVVPCSRTQQAWSLPGRGPRHGRPPSEARRAGPRTGLFRAVPEQHSCPGARAATTRESLRVRLALLAGEEARAQPLPDTSRVIMGWRACGLGHLAGQRLGTLGPAYPRTMPEPLPRARVSRGEPGPGPSKATWEELRTQPSASKDGERV